MTPSLENRVRWAAIVTLVAGATLVGSCAAEDAAFSASDGSSGGSAGAAGPGSFSGCTSAPNCGGCVRCFDACLCQTSDAVNCQTRCNAPPPQVDGGAVEPPPPPEAELEESFLAPVTTGTLVWSANPDSGRVAVVDATSLEVRTVEAGFRPTFLTAVAANQGDASVAAVINTGSRDATIFRASGSDIETEHLEVHEDANRWAVSQSGRWAIAWTSANAFEAPDPTDGFQDVTVLRLDHGSESAVRLSVGFRPRQVVFSDDETQAFAITEPGVSVLELDELGPRVGALVEVTDDPLENPASRDVTITPDGNFALVRRDLSADVDFVDLQTGERRSVTLADEVTDLDLSADGTLAVAVVRAASEVSVLPIPEAIDDPTAIDSVEIADQVFGSVAMPPSAEVAVLFTNALPTDRVTILDTRGADFLSHRTVALKTSVFAVFAAPDAEHAIAFQTPGSDLKKGAFSIIPTRELRSPKIVGTDAATVSVALSPPPTRRALITVRDDAADNHGVYLARMPSLQVDRIALASAPLAAGMVPEAGRGFVAQLHPEGRISFVDLDDGSVRTLTGFELGSKVVD